MPKIAEDRQGHHPASRIHSPEQLAEVCRELLSVHRQPVLIEPYLPGREFTVGVWGTGRDSEVIGTLEIVLRAHAEEGVYSYVNKEQCEELVDYLPVSAERDATVREAETIALDAWKALGCRDAGGLTSVATSRPCPGHGAEPSCFPSGVICR